MTERDRRGAAYHEAGHVVVAWHSGLAVGCIEIGIGGDDAAGNVQIECSKGLPLTERLAIALAGVNAQKMFGAPTHRRSGACDHRKVMKLVRGLDEDASLSARNAGHQHAWDLLKRHSKQVERLAEHLIANGKIDQDTVRRLLGGAPSA